MKIVLILLLLVGVGFYFVYNSGVKQLDPVADGEKTMSAITPGMTLAKVIGVAPKPLHFEVIVEKTRQVGGQTNTEYVRTGQNKFRLENVESRIKDDSLPHGFVLVYRYAVSMEFEVTFDRDGFVEAVDKRRTVADLLDQ